MFATMPIWGVDKFRQSMQVFVVVAIQKPIDVEENLKVVTPEKYFAVKDGVWLAAFDGTAQQLAEKLEIRSGKAGTGLVTPISNYSGRASSDLWEWLKVNWPAEKIRND
jgi:hypothetical protein